MPLRPWVGTEPVQVRPDIPKQAYEQKRITLYNKDGWTLNTVRYLEPPNMHYWVVDSVQMEYTGSIVEGTRDMYFYLRDKYSNIVRQRTARIVKQTSAVMIGTPYSSYNGNDAATSVGSFPLYAQYVDDQSAIGAAVSNFYDSGDTYNVHAFVREYKVV